MEELKEAPKQLNQDGRKGDGDNNVRITPPGRKRLFLTISVVFSFLLGVPFWWKSTEVYRAPLPFTAIEEHASSLASTAFTLPCHLHIIFTSHTTEDIPRSSLENVANFLQAQNFDVTVTFDKSCVSVGSDDHHWPCGLTNSGLHDIHSDEEMDEFLWRYSKESSRGGRYTLVVIGSEGSTRTVVGKYRHAWMTGVDFGALDGISSRIAEVAVTYFKNGGRGSRAVEEEQVASMPLSADGEAILSFSLLNANPEDWIFDWDIEEVEERYLQPLIDVMEPVARLSFESQVLYYTPKAVSSHWDGALKAHLVPFKQLPFFVNSNEWHLDTSSAATGRSKLLNFAM